MSSNGANDLMPIYFRHANPLLYTLQQDHMTIQPYWIMVLQILALQILQRIWSWIRYKEFLSTIEIGLIRWVLWAQIVLIKDTLDDVGNVANEFQGIWRDLFQQLVSLVKEHRVDSKLRRLELLKKLQFDLFNFIFHFLPLFGHGVWYCYIQSSCMSAEGATTWNCYNAFGYRLYNYIFVSYANFFWIFIIKIIAQTEKHYPKFKRWSFDWFSYHLGLWSSIITFVFDGFLVLPYLFTHIIPMVFAYPFMTVVYFALWSAILCFAVCILDKIPIAKKLVPIPKIISVAYRQLAVVPFIFGLAVYTYPILMSTLYNYSQYLYYGENYIYTMTDEFTTRDTTRYLKILQESINEKFHTALNFI